MYKTPLRVTYNYVVADHLNAYYLSCGYNALCAFATDMENAIWMSLLQAYETANNVEVSISDLSR